MRWLPQRGERPYFWCAAALLCAASTPAPALSADPDSTGDGRWMVRVRGVYLDPADKSDAIPLLGVPKDAIHINGKGLPDLDLEYFFTPYWSTELVVSYPQKQTVTVEQSALGGPTVLGSFEHLPPVLILKYNFRPYAGFRPYVGVGANLTIIWDVNLAIPTSPAIPLSLNSTSVGVAGQAGFDLKFADHWFANADVKWVKLASEIKAGGVILSTAHIDPWLFGLGVGYRFGAGK